MPTATHLLIRGSWQDVNIGDVAHSPGMIGLLQRHWPLAIPTLWPGRMSQATRAMLLGHFPHLTILDREDEREIERAISESEMLIHVSGSGFPGREQVQRWMSRTDKPFGFFGISYLGASREDREVLERASFCLTRETESIPKLAADGFAKLGASFVPDSAFACCVRDDASAVAMLDELGLDSNRPFLCVIPRLRITPYHWHIPGRFTPEREAEIEATNARHIAADALKLRSVIDWYVRTVGGQVLLCCEMSYQLRILDKWLIEPLDHQVKPHVFAQRHWWQLDTAMGVYARASGVVSCECHSPILALRLGRPTIYLQQPQDTHKGRMFRDIGAGRSLMPIEACEGGDVIRVLESMLAAGGFGSPMDRVDALQHLGVERMKSALS